MQAWAIESESMQSLPVLRPRCSNATPALTLLDGDESRRRDLRMRPSGWSFGYSPVHHWVTAGRRGLGSEKRWPDMTCGGAGAAARRERRGRSIRSTWGFKQHCPTVPVNPILGGTLQLVRPCVWGFDGRPIGRGTTRFVAYSPSFWGCTQRLHGSSVGRMGLTAPIGGSILHTLWRSQRIRLA
jgi:hypothetical protein